MSKKNIKKASRLLVVAHPDDETIFFSALLMNLTKSPWTVICVTDGNADGAGPTRAAQFKKACQMLKVKNPIQWDFPDRFEERLNTERLIQKLQELPPPVEVYTHSIIGDYGHPHHQDVSYAVHKAFYKKVKVHSLAYNCEAKKVYQLTSAQHKLKSKIYSKVYAGETLRFARFLPNNSVDQLIEASWSEVEEIYASQIEKREPDLKKLKLYRWFHSYLSQTNKNPNSRPF